MKNKKEHCVVEGQVQTEAPTKNHTSKDKEHPAVKTPVTDASKNTASQMTGLNQTKTVREDLLPPD